MAHLHGSTITVLAILASCFAIDIGGNVGGVDYRGRTHAYVNLIRQAQPWVSLKNNSNFARVDGNGWPLEDFTVYLQTLGADLQGNYSIAMIGNATVTSLAHGTVVDLKHDTASGRTTAILAITDANATDIHLQFANLTASGVQNITVMLPNFTSDQADEINPAYIAQLKRYSTLRMLPITKVDRVFLSNWTQRAIPATSPSYSTFCCPLYRNDSSVPWEDVVKLANKVQPKAVWLNMQVVANDDYFIQLAKLLKDRLDENIAIYTEFGNEMWNGGFPAEWHVAEAAKASVQAGDPYNLDFDHCNSSTVWSARLSAYNAAVRIPNLFAKVFGTAQVGRGNVRVRPLLAGQSSDYKFLQEQLEYLRLTQPGAIDRLASLAMAAYFGIERELSRNNSLTGAEILASFNRSLALHRPSIQTQYAAHAMLQVWYGVPEMRGYESGPSSSGGNSVPGKVEAHQSPQMQDLVERMYLYWHQHGFDDLNYFHSGIQTYNWEYGQWGTHWRASMPVTSKTLALDAVASQALPELALGTVLPVTNYSSVLYLDYYSKVPGTIPANPNITWVTQNNTFNYLFRRPNHAAPTTMQVTVYTSTVKPNATGCTLHVTVASPTTKPSTAVMTLPPTHDKHTFVGNTAKLSFGSGLNVLRLQAVGTGPCANFDSHNNKTILSMFIGAIDVV